LISYNQETASYHIPSHFSYNPFNLGNQKSHMTNNDQIWDYLNSPLSILPIDTDSILQSIQEKEEVGQEGNEVAINLPLPPQSYSPFQRLQSQPSEEVGMVENKESPCILDVIVGQVDSNRHQFTAFLSTTCQIFTTPDFLNYLSSITLPTSLIRFNINPPSNLAVIGKHSSRIHLSNLISQSSSTRGIKKRNEDEEELILFHSFSIQLQSKTNSNSLMKGNLSPLIQLLSISISFEHTSLDEPFIFEISPTSIKI